MSDSCNAQSRRGREKAKRVTDGQTEREREGGSPIIVAWSLFSRWADIRLPASLPVEFFFFFFFFFPSRLWELCNSVALSPECGCSCVSLCCQRQKGGKRGGESHSKLYYHSKDLRRGSFILQCWDARQCLQTEKVKIQCMKGKTQGYMLE